jgi:hypothetical protein
VQLVENLLSSTKALLALPVFEHAEPLWCLWEAYLNLDKAEHALVKAEEVPFYSLPSSLLARTSGRR